MLKTIIYGLFTVLLGFFSFSSCKMGCTPAPVEKLPTPIEMKIDFPESVLVYTDREIDLFVRLRNNKIAHEHQSMEEWEKMCGDPDVVSLAVFTTFRQIDLFSIKKDGTIYLSRKPYEIDTTSFGSYGIEKRVIDRDRMVLIIYPGGESFDQIILIILGLLMWMVTLVVLMFTIGEFENWRRIRRQRVVAVAD